MGIVDGAIVSLGEADGASEGASEGKQDGASEGASEGKQDGARLVGRSVGRIVGSSDGNNEGVLVGNAEPEGWGGRGSITGRIVPRRKVGASELAEGDEEGPISVEERVGVDEGGFAIGFMAGLMEGGRITAVFVVELSAKIAISDFDKLRL